MLLLLTDLLRPTFPPQHGVLPLLQGRPALGEVLAERLVPLGMLPEPKAHLLPLAENSSWVFRQKDICSILELTVGEEGSVLLLCPSITSARCVSGSTHQLHRAPHTERQLVSEQPTGNISPAAGDGGIQTGSKGWELCFLKGFRHCNTVTAMNSCAVPNPAGACMCWSGDGQSAGPILKCRVSFKAVLILPLKEAAAVRVNVWGTEDGAVVFVSSVNTQSKRKESEFFLIFLASQQLDLTSF